MQNQGTKSDIIRAATQIFVKHGLSHLPYELIASEAGTSKEAIRSFYPDPEDLAMDLCGRISAWFDEGLEKEFKKLPKAEQFTSLMNFYLGLPSKLSKSKRDDDQVINALMALASKSEDIQTELRDYYTTMQNRIAYSIKRSFSDLKPKQRDELAFQIVCLIYGHWRMVASLNFSEQYNQVARACVDRLISTHH